MQGGPGDTRDGQARLVLVIGKNKLESRADTLNIAFEWWSCRYRTRVKPFFPFRYMLQILLLPASGLAAFNPTAQKTTVSERSFFPFALHPPHFR